MLQMRNEAGRAQAATPAPGMPDLRGTPPPPGVAAMTIGNPCIGDTGYPGYCQGWGECSSNGGDCDSDADCTAKDGGVCYQNHCHYPGDAA